MPVSKLKAKAFAKQWKEWSVTIPQQTVNEYQSAVLRTFFMYLMVYTPIDTGRLRGNWKVSINSKPTGSSQKRMTDATQTGAPPTAQEIQYVLGFVKTMRSKPVGQVIWVGNLLHYAKFVEFGTSRMTARAMMERAVVSTKARMGAGNVRYQDIGS